MATPKMSSYADAIRLVNRLLPYANYQKEAAHAVNPEVSDQMHTLEQLVQFLDENDKRKLELQIEKLDRLKEEAPLDSIARFLKGCIAKGGTPENCIPTERVISQADCSRYYWTGKALIQYAILSAKDLLLIRW